MNSREIAENIRKQLAEYLNNYAIKALVIGESGGIDSALCTVLASPVCNKLSISLIGRSITIETNQADEIERGKNIGEAFCTNFKAVDLTETYFKMRNSVEEESQEKEFDKKLRRGNIKARIRMVYLYNLAQQNRGLVLSTDNYTEYLEGFWTLHGDVGDFGMIQELWKTEVYELAQWLVDNELETQEQKNALQACIDANPTDGLGITNSDLEQLGCASYKEVDQILKEYLGSGLHANHAVVMRHLASHYKRNNPYNLGRDKIIN